MANQIEIEVVLNDGSVVKGIGNLKQRFEKGGEEAGRSFSSGFGNFLTIAAGNIAAQAVGSALREIRGQITGVVQAAQSLELFETQFRTILGSSRAAQRQLEDLQNFAATTPFQLPGLTESTRQLLSFGVAQEEIIPTLRQLGDLAAGTGAEIQDLTIPFGRLVSTQKLTLVELDKFADRGINLYGKLAEQTGISLKNIRDEISKGRVPFEEFTKALTDLTTEGGTFFGATEAQSKTLGGLFSTLSDNIFNFQATLGQVFGPFLKAAVNQGISFFQSLTESVKNNTQAIVNGFFDALEVIAEFGQGAVFLKNIFVGAFDAIQLGFNAVFAGILNTLNGISSLASSVGVDLPFKDELNDLAETVNETTTQMAEDLAGFTDSDIFGEEFRERIDLLIAKFREAGESIPPEVMKVADSLKNMKNTVEKQITETDAVVEKNAKSINSAISGALARGLSSTIQKLAGNLAAGKNLFADFGSFVLNLIGDMAIQIGQAAIGIGIAMEAIGSLSGTQAIIAGAGLVAIGTIIKSFAGGGESGLGGASGVGGTSIGGVGGDFTTPDEAFLSDQTEQREPETRIAVNITGDVLDSRESGLRIVELLNDAFDRDGAIVTGSAV